MTHEQKPESAEFRTREAQIRELCASCHFEEVATAHILEAEARGAAEQRRKDAEGTKPVGCVTRRQADGAPMFDGVYIADPPAFGAVVYNCSANVAALESRVNELEGEMERRIAEAAVAEREKIAGKLDEVAKHLARPWGSYLTEEGIAVKEACAARVEQEAAAIREGGEHG